MIVDDQVMRAQIPKPKVYIIQNDSPNAFATGRSPKKASIAATTGIIHLLTREELGGVIAHELAHVGNRDTLIMTMVATAASAIGMIAFMAQFALIFGGFGGRGRGGGGYGSAIGIGALLLIAIVVPLLATLVRLAVSRTREFQADATGAKTSGNHLALADGLEKLETWSKRVPMEANQAVAHLYIVEPLHGKSMSFLNGQGHDATLLHPPAHCRQGQKIEEYARGLVSPKTVLVTGGAGFIGSHLVDRLLELGTSGGRAGRPHCWQASQPT